MRYLMILAACSFTLAATAEARLGFPQSAAAGQPGVAQGRIVLACSGCGCRGGAGYRLSNGKCAPRGR